MKSTFNLKEPNSDKETLIIFSAYFKKENKKFVYSTGEFILPSEWDGVNKQPKDVNGRSAKADNHRLILRQLQRYSNLLDSKERLYKQAQQELTIEAMRNEFNTEFKRTKAISNRFFEVYDLFLKAKKEDYTETANAKTTIKRYEYNKSHLLDFQNHSKKSIHFNSINQSFYKSFCHFCVTEKGHGANTLRRNMGMFKTFLYWSLDNGHTYKVDFQKFVMPKEHPTDEIALSMDKVQNLFKYDLSNFQRLEKVRDLFVFGCSTGMRISNYSKVSKKDIIDGFIKVRDFKDKNKPLEVPINDLSSYILQKYDYNLPKITTQKFNMYIKEVFEKMGLVELTKKTTKLGNEILETMIPFNERISSHTARRSFITIMLNAKVPDKIIMSYTGHKDFKVFMKYYKPNEDDKKEFMTTVWKMNSAPLKMVN